MALIPWVGHWDRMRSACLSWGGWTDYCFQLQPMGKVCKKPKGAFVSGSWGRPGTFLPLSGHCSVLDAPGRFAALQGPLGLASGSPGSWEPVLSPLSMRNLDSARLPDLLTVTQLTSPMPLGHTLQPAPVLIDALGGPHLLVGPGLQRYPG